jgi:pimeloyl-ACP methyl ester carboxylesterase
MEHSSLFDRFEVRQYLPKIGTHKGESPVLIVPGWGMDTSTLSETADKLSSFGRRVFTFNYRKPEKNAPVQQPTEVITRKSDMVRDVAEEIYQVTGRTVDIFAYSEGCLVALYAWQLDTKNVNRFCFVAPAGIHEAKSYVGILADVIRNGISGAMTTHKASNSTKLRLAKHKASCKQWMESQSIFKGVIESLAPGRIDCFDLYRTLACSGKAKFVFFENDVMVPVRSRVVESLVGTKAPVHTILAAGHSGFYTAQDEVVRIFLSR